MRKSTSTRTYSARHPIVPPSCSRTFLCVPVPPTPLRFFFFFFKDPAPPDFYPLSLHDALPISRWHRPGMTKRASPMRSEPPPQSEEVKRSDQALTPAPIGHDTPVPPSPQ